MEKIGRGRVISLDEVRSSIKPRENGFKEWDEATCLEYLRKLTCDKWYLLPNTEYPQIFHLSETWHTILNRIRDETKANNHEHWAYIGYKQKKDGVYLSQVPVKGERNAITHDIVEREMKKAFLRDGIIGQIGQIHSHSDPLDKAFSLPDFHNFFLGEVGESYIQGLTAGEWNLFAFATANTRPITWDIFSSTWQLKDLKGLPMNKAVAKEHHLVLYQGMKNAPLVQLFPQNHTQSGMLIEGKFPLVNTNR